MNVKNKNELYEIFEKCGLSGIRIPAEIENRVTDIHISVNKPVTLYTYNDKYETSISYSSKDINDLFLKINDYSLYRQSTNIKNGYIILNSKYRCGICGTAVYKNNELVTIKNISSINIRVPRNVKGAADEVVKSCKAKLLYGVLLVGEPSSGKTTVLKDLVTQLGDYRVALLDERNELYCGQKCDVISGINKKEGISRLMRTMSPEIIVCDELDSGDTSAIECAVSSGVCVIASAHGDLNAKFIRPALKDLLETGAFNTVIQLSSRECPGKIRRIYSIEELNEIFELYSCGQQRLFSRI